MCFERCMPNALPLHKQSSRALEIHTKFMGNLFFPLGRHRSGRRRTCVSTFDMDVNVNMNVIVNMNTYVYICAYNYKYEYKYEYEYEYEYEYGYGHE